jgi:hypothetical protein
MCNGRCVTLNNNNNNNNNNKHNQKEGKSRGPLTALKRMVSTPRKLNMHHLKVHLTSEWGKKMERN